jgi:hypothetical protein
MTFYKYTGNLPKEVIFFLDSFYDTQRMPQCTSTKQNNKKFENFKKTEEIKRTK